MSNKRRLVGPFICKQCRQPYMAKRKAHNTYCTRECCFLHKGKIEQEIDAIRKISKNIARGIKALQRIDSLKKAEQSKVIHIDRIANKKCKVCGSPVGYKHRSPKKYCSDVCRSIGYGASREAFKQTDAYRAAKRKAKAKRRAIERGLEAHSIDPIRVFERDGWRCHMCNKKLNPIDRGTIKPLAPELDHIVPISKGGKHIWSNVACSCRLCNSTKSDKPFGQLFLL
jgi:5-methylcytosine-specific restriction endonuclease McrA